MFNFFDTEDFFFDCVNHLEGEISNTNVPFGYGLRRSVEERRDLFLREMGFVEEFSSSLEIDNVLSLDTEEDLISEASSCSRSDKEFYITEGNSAVVANIEEHRAVNSVCKRVRNWWKDATCKQSRRKCKVEEGKPKKRGVRRIKTRVHEKGLKELSALFESEEIRAHEGVIRTMRFSQDGEYLASGGQDGVVKIWRVKSIDSKFGDEFGPREKKAKSQVVIPEKMFGIEERPLRELRGHSGEVLDLAWSNSNCLLSASTDKTVRLWEIGSEECLNIFNHTDYEIQVENLLAFGAVKVCPFSENPSKVIRTMTCVQFNPKDERSFISGSVDGKVRIWGVSKGRVLDWADIGDAVTAVSYQPDGEGFVVGSLGGKCRSYDVKCNLLELTERMLTRGNRKRSKNRITGIQFSPHDSQTVIATCEHSKLRLFKKTETYRKYKGLPNSGSQTSASFTSNGRHIVSIGDDSRVHIWSPEDPSAKSNKSNLSCEHFCVENVSVALPWSGNTKTANLQDFSPPQSHHPRSFSFSSLFSSKRRKTCPEEMLPVTANPLDEPALLTSWGLVIVTGNCDGIIRTFHNYGLPVRV